MNKHIKCLLLAALTLSATRAHATNKYTNQTYLGPRPHGINLPMYYTTFHELYARKVGHTFGGNLQATGFYQQSAQAKSLARYFLFNNQETIMLNTAAAAADTTLSTQGDLDLGYLIHDTTGTAAQSAKIALRPRQQSYGMRFDYHHDLSKIMRGLFSYAGTTLVHIENDPHLVVSATGVFADGAVGPAGISTAVKTTLQQFFSGSFGTARQAKLTNQRIDGKQSVNGMADIDLGLGYTFCNKETMSCAFAIAATIPTGNKVESIYAFEALAGSGKHFALGADLKAHVRVAGNHHHNLNVALIAKYRYLFEHNESRTLGIKGRNWGQYLLLAQTGQSFLQPAANVLTRNVDVTPGNLFDGLINFCYNTCNLTFDIGYDLYLRQAETVKLREAFPDGTYAIAARSFNTSSAAPATFVAADNITDGGAAEGASAILTSKNIDIDRAATPSQCSHGFYSSIGYHAQEGNNPWFISIGGKYDWATRNSMFDQWSVWGKMGIGF